MMGEKKKRTEPAVLTSPDDMPVSKPYVSCVMCIVYGLLCALGLGMQFCFNYPTFAF